MRKKSHYKSKKRKSVKKHSFLGAVIFLILLGFLLIITYQVQQRQVFQGHAAILGCGDPGDPGNEDGVGKYCTQGGGQCLGTGSPICSADIETGQPGLCSKPCSTDADCGTGAVCMASTLGSGCEPIACETTITPTSVPSPTRIPTLIPTVTPTLEPTITPTPTLIPTPTIIVSTNATTLQLTVFLNGIGGSGDLINPNTSTLSDKNPVHTARAFSISLINSIGQNAGTFSTTLNFNSSNGNYSGILNLGTTFATGVYTITIKTYSFLSTNGQNIQITSGQQATIPSQTLVAGDINGDGSINIMDYNFLYGCYGDSSNTSSCLDYQAADLNDDGVINGKDLNLLLREMSGISQGK